MGKLIIDCAEKKINFKKIAKAVYKTLGQKTLIKAELVFIDGAGIQELNRSTRAVDKVTDVLSYPSLDGIRGKVLDKNDYPYELDGRYLFIGSIALCEDKIKEQAEEYGHSLEREMTYLIVHGLMHLFGYDHMTDEDKSEMREKEKCALKLLGVED
jgi:probable rRNA maturation factor